MILRFMFSLVIGLLDKYSTRLTISKMSYISWCELLEFRSLSYDRSSSSSFPIVLQKMWLNLQKQMNSDNKLYLKHTTDILTKF